VFFVSSTLDTDKEENAWNFRIAAQRLVVVKTKSAPVR
jgi:hypothetical protein